MRRRDELTDAQWEKIKNLLPGKDGGPDRAAIDDRLFVNAVLYVLKTGIPWEDLSTRYGKPDTVLLAQKLTSSGTWRPQDQG